VTYPKREAGFVITATADAEKDDGDGSIFGSARDSTTLLLYYLLYDILDWQ
jgi:hypothetical protein